MATGLNASAPLASVPFAAADRIECVRKDIEFSVVSGSSEEMLFSCLESVHAQMPTNATCQWSLTVTCSAEAGELLPKRVSRRYPHARVVVARVPLHAMTVHTSVLRESDARYVCLIDGDTVFLPGAIGLITSYLERPENSRVGIVGPNCSAPMACMRGQVTGFPQCGGCSLSIRGLAA